MKDIKEVIANLDREARAMKNTYWNCANEIMRRRRDDDIVMMYTHRHSTLREIAAEVNCAHETVRAVLRRRCPDKYRARGKPAHD